MLLSFALTCLSSLSCAGAVVSSSEELGNSSEATPSSIVANVLEGDITWEDENGAEHPLPGIKIEVGAERKISTTTDSSGHYSFYMVEVKAASMDFPPVFTVYLETDHAKIYDYYRVPYVKHWDLRGVSLDGSYEISHEFTSDGDGELGEAAQILCAVDAFAKHAVDLNGSDQFGQCKIVYPHNDPSKGAFYFETCIYIQNKNEYQGKGYVPTYADWDVIGHEYGYHVQRCLFLPGSPGGTHWQGVNCIGHEIENGGLSSLAKSKGLQLAFGEAWPTFFSVVAQQSFSDDLKTVPVVGDAVYESSNGPTLDLSLPILEWDGFESLGDACEGPISSILYHYWSREETSFDDVCIAEQEMFDCLKEYRPRYFSEFYSALVSEGYDQFALGKVTSYFNFTPSTISISGHFLDGVIAGGIRGGPTFTWKAYSGVEQLPLDYDLVFEGAFGGEIFRKRIDNVPNGADATCTLTIDEWNNVVSYAGNGYVVYVETSQNTYFQTGPYYSEKFFFQEPTDFSQFTQIKPSEWNFEERYWFLDEGIKETSFTLDGVSFETERLRCGYIEEQFVNLSPRRENAGHAYFKITFDRPAYGYMFGASIWSSTEGLNGDDCEAGVYRLDQNGEPIHPCDFDLLNASLSTNRLNVKRFAKYDESGFYGLLIEATAPAEGDRNKGRICIDDIVLSFDEGETFPITGYSAIVERV